MARHNLAEVGDDYELSEVEDNLRGTLASRLALFSKEFAHRSHENGLRLSKGCLANFVIRPDSRSHENGSHENGLRFAKGCLANFFIRPDSRSYQWWTRFILLWATYSSFFTPLEFGFYRGLPSHLGTFDAVVQIIFLADVVVQFFVAYRDMQTYKLVYKPSSIALRYAKTSFLPELLGCLPWDAIYKGTGRLEVVRYLIWVRLYRVLKVTEFFQRMEKDIRINYMFTRIVKLITVELYCTHTAACIFYYLATTIPPSREGSTWIGSLVLGDDHYTNFRDIGLFKRYITSLYFAIVTMATVGYGDMHAVNTREMIFLMIYISFDMILGAYLIGNMTALIVKGSKTERFRDKMTDLIKFMNRNKLGREIRAQIKGHQRLQYESSYNEASVLQDIPVSIRAKVSQTLYRSTVKEVPLFKGCSSEFLNQIVTRVHEEFFLPGEVIMEQGNAVDQLYIVSHGSLEEVVIGGDGSEETVAKREPHSIFGEIAVLCNIPQPYNVRVCELCRLLRLDKQSFSNILQLYFADGRQILNNLLEGKNTDLRVKQLESDITCLIAKQEAELALRVNSAAYHGDLYHLRNLIKAGADPRKPDYDGRTALHLAASKGYEDIAMFLIKEGADMNCTDKFGNTPLLEAVKTGHDRIAALLVNNGASLDLEDGGSYLCKAVASGRTGFLKRLLAYGMDPNSKDYDKRTPLHIAAAEGLHLVAKILLDAGANVLSTDRWGNTPLDEAKKCGSKPLLQMLEKAKENYFSHEIRGLNGAEASSNLTSPTNTLDEDILVLDSTPDSVAESACGQSQSVERNLLDGPTLQAAGTTVLPSKEQEATICTVFPFHPWAPRENRKHGIVMWVPETIEDLIEEAKKHFGFIGTCLLTEDGGQILHVNLIQNNQKLYLVD